jgi:hypothetical protein
MRGKLVQVQWVERAIHLTAQHNQVSLGNDFDLPAFAGRPANGVFSH